MIHPPRQRLFSSSLSRFANNPLVSETKIMKLIFQHWKKWSHFDLKIWVTGGTKIGTRIPSNWKIFESNWLDIESQIDWLNFLGQNDWIFFFQWGYQRAIISIELEQNYLIEEKNYFYFFSSISSINDLCNGN